MLEPGTELEKSWKEALQWGGLKPDTDLPKPEPIFPRREAQVQ